MSFEMQLSSKQFSSFISLSRRSLTSVVAAALCFCCPLPLLPPASALCCCCPLPLLATAAAACHCSLSQARRRHVGAPLPARRLRPACLLLVPAQQQQLLQAALPLFLLPFSFLPWLFFLSLSLTPTHSFSVTYRRPTPNCKQPPPGGSPPPEPSSSSPTSPASILVGSGSAGTPCASAASPSPSAEAASVRCLLDPLPRPHPCACARAATHSSASRRPCAGASRGRRRRAGSGARRRSHGGGHGAELLHPPCADEHGGAQVLGNGDAPTGGWRCRRRRRGAGTFRAAELIDESSLPPSTFSAAG